jgi:hypothetical protein
VGGGAWPFLVGGAICLVNSDNERDSSLLNRWLVLYELKSSLGSQSFWIRVLRRGGGCVRFVPYFGAVRGGRPRRPSQGPRKANCVLASVTTLLRGTSGV